MLEDNWVNYWQEFPLLTLWYEMVSRPPGEPHAHGKSKITVTLCLFKYRYEIPLHGFTQMAGCMILSAFDKFMRFIEEVPSVTVFKNCFESRGCIEGRGDVAWFFTCRHHNKSPLKQIFQERFE